MISAAIIDDEKNNVENLRGLLEKYCPEVTVIATANNADEGAVIIMRSQPELVFLDIQMPSKNGFEMLQSLPAYNFELVFVTAFDQYGIQAVKFSAMDYLLKPVVIDELKAAVVKAMERIRAKKQNVQLENLLSFLRHKGKKHEHRLALPVAKEIRFVNSEQIIRCESSNSYTTFYLTDGHKIVVSRPIFEYEELLNDYGFIRCHQSHLINKAKVKSWIKEDGGYLLLEDGSRVPVSKSKKELVSEALLKAGD